MQNASVVKASTNIIKRTVIREKFHRMSSMVFVPFSVHDMVVSVVSLAVVIFLFKSLGINTLLSKSLDTKGSLPKVVQATTLN
jgi:hypothetical protein